MQSSSDIIWRLSNVGSVPAEADGGGVNHCRKEFPPKNATELASFTLRERVVFERVRQLTECKEYESRVWLISREKRRSIPSNPGARRSIRRFSEK